MSGKHLRMNPIGSRKKVLLAESELNRDQLIGSVAALATDIGVMTHRAKSIGSIASSAAVLVVALSTFRGFWLARAAQKLPWLQTARKGAGLISAVWLAFRSKRRAHENK